MASSERWSPTGSLTPEPGTVGVVEVRLEEIRDRALGLPYPGRAWLADWLVQQAESAGWDWCDDVEIELIVRVGPVASGWDNQPADDIYREAEPIRDAALAMTESDREQLVRDLVLSVGPDTADARRAAAEWTAELQRRIEEAERGEGTSVSWEQLKARLLSEHSTSHEEHTGDA